MMAAEFCSLHGHKQADGKRATLLAEAEGMKQLGRRAARRPKLVEMEYAKHLEKVHFHRYGGKRHPPFSSSPCSLPMLPCGVRHGQGGVK